MYNSKVRSMEHGRRNQVASLVNKKPPLLSAKKNMEQSNSRDRCPTLALVAGISGFLLGAILSSLLCVCNP